MLPQLALDPRDKSTKGVYESELPIRLKTRKLGIYPNTQEWLPADLLLVSQINRSWTQNFIVNGQLQGGYPEKDARWGHVAIYLGDNEICEAMPSGVRHLSIEEYVDGNHLLRLRRDTALSEEQRWRIAIRALTRLRTGYAFGRAFELAGLLVRGFNNLQFALRRNKSTCICSELYANAYSPISGKVLQNSKSGEITPAFLSSTTQLEDVSIYWRALPTE